MLTCSRNMPHIYLIGGAITVSCTMPPLPLEVQFNASATNPKPYPNCLFRSHGITELQAAMSASH